MIVGPILALNYIIVRKLTHFCLVDLINVTLAVVDTDLAKVDDGNKVFTAVYYFIDFSFCTLDMIISQPKIVAFNTCCIADPISEDI